MTELRLRASAPITASYTDPYAEYGGQDARVQYVPLSSSIETTPSHCMASVYSMFAAYATRKGRPD